jgi:hypothetical protein
MAYAKATKKERKIKIEEFCPAPRETNRIILNSQNWQGTC